MTAETMVALSLGGGVQSSVLTLLLDKQMLSPMPDLGIFADTYVDTPGVYERLIWLSSAIENFPIVWTRRFHKNRGFISLANDLRNNVQGQGITYGGDSIPAHTISEGKAQGHSRRGNAHRLTRSRR